MLHRLKGYVACKGDLKCIGEVNSAASMSAECLEELGPRPDLTDPKARARLFLRCALKKTYAKACGEEPKCPKDRFSGQFETCFDTAFPVEREITQVTGREGAADLDACLSRTIRLDVPAW